MTNDYLTALSSPACDCEPGVPLGLALGLLVAAILTNSG